eukprot:GHVT01025035.1.p2 GENE.GHVT01025035.1~~GHVT01025035.1.p2  ORF type:complete len:145 (+),score=20.20 GHVT01025035.1:2325-2759(+)
MAAGTPSQSASMGSYTFTAAAPLPTAGAPFSGPYAGATYLQSADDPQAAPGTTVGSRQTEQLHGDYPDLSVYIQRLIRDMQSKFQTMSDEVCGRLDDMTGRIEEVEKTIGDLLNQATTSIDTRDEETDDDGNAQGRRRDRRRRE